MSHRAKFVPIDQTVAEMAVFRCFKIAAVRHLGFVVRLLGTTHEEQLILFIVVQNLVEMGGV